MSEVVTPEQPRIKLLAHDIASKIAAGEVVERPASVLKELLENSLDAGATKIAVTIEQGGMRSITVTDNGSGILKADLTLALQQHATSKIATVQDLENIHSLGFRGEALASIDSVAKLSITSQTAQQDHAWCISKQKVTPAAHPVGTTVAMQDLFYNLPARRKFLRSERTEYLYLEEMFKRIALSNFAVAFSLTKHGKVIKHLPACTDATSRLRRVISLCGNIANQALSIDADQNGMRLWGWVGLPTAARSQEIHQYFFINQRVIKDRVINHALRQVYQPLCAPGKMPFYCLYLELDPAALDVNVHPTKHEVRFRDARIVHAFLTEILNAALQQPLSSTKINTYPKAALTEKAAHLTADASLQILCHLENKILVAHCNNKLLFLDSLAMRKHLIEQALAQNKTQYIFAQPQSFAVPSTYLDEDFLNWSQNLQFVLEAFGTQKLLLRAIPKVLALQTLDIQALLPKLYTAWSKQADLPTSYAAITSCIDYNVALSNPAMQQLVQQFYDLGLKQYGREFNAADLLTKFLVY